MGSEMKSATQFMTYLPNRVRFMNFWLQAITRPLGRVPGQTGYLGMPTSSKLSVSAVRWSIWGLSTPGSRHKSGCLSGFYVDFSSSNSIILDWFRVLQSLWIHSITLKINQTTQNPRTLGLHTPQDCSQQTFWKWVFYSPTSFYSVSECWIHPNNPLSGSENIEDVLGMG